MGAASGKIQKLNLDTGLEANFCSHGRWKTKALTTGAGDVRKQETKRLLLFVLDHLAER